MMRKMIYVSLTLGLTLGAATGQALAWGCTAVDSQGAYGYSYNWPDEQDAELAALKQCDKYTKTKDCQTESCDPNG
jgi:spermidine/putrescine-binding protein